MTTAIELIKTILPDEPTVRRESSCFRPMYTLGRQIGRICVHNGSEILLTKQQGWLEYTDDLESVSYSGKDVTALFIEVRQDRTINLSKKYHFIVKYADKDKSYFESGYALYIYAPDFKIIKTLERTEEYATYSVDLCELPISAHILNPELDENGKLIYKEKWISSILMQCNYRSVNTPLGNAVSILKNKMNEVIGQDRLSTYDLEKLVKHFTITEK